MYWDLTVFLNFLVDYLLLFAAARLSGTAEKAGMSVGDFTKEMKLAGYVIPAV